MEKVLLGKSGLEISKIFYGGIISMSDGQDLSDQYVEFAIKNGVNYFDVAPTYQDAEEKLGNSLKPFRKDVFLACKTTERDSEGAKKDLETSLKLLHTDHFDVYQLHSITTVEEVDKVFAKGGAFETILKAKEEGVLKHLGITCHSEEAALRALEHYDFETILFPINWGLYTKKDFGKKILPVCKEKNMGILGMKGLVHRAWASKEEKALSIYPKSWCKPIYKEDTEFRIAALKFALECGAHALVMPGNYECFSFAVEHLNEILQPITQKERDLLTQKAIEIGEQYFF